MSAFLLRAVLSGIIIALIAMIGRKAPAMAALIASLPLVSILGMIWLWRDTGDSGLLADHSAATFFYVIPSLPMFLIIAWMLRGGYSFWTTMATGIGTTILLYLAIIVVAARFGIRLS